MFLSILASVVTMNTTSPIPFYIGTYTSSEGSQGIYRSTLDPDSGQLSDPQLVANVTNPSFLAFSPDNSRLFAVQETGDGLIHSFLVKSTGDLTPINSAANAGASPCHLDVSPDGKSLMTASYSDGVFAQYTISENGQITLKNRYQNEGSGPNTQRQTSPHAHAITFSSDGKFAFGVDLGADEVLTINAETAKTVHQSKTPPGSGPRHIALHPNGQFAYVNGELDNTVITYRIGKDGSLTQLQVLSTLPADFSGNSATAEILVHPTGNFVYVSNRGHDSVAIYKTSSQGTLTLVEIKPLGLNNPRGMDISPDGSWLVVGGQDTNDIKAFPIDPSSGKLGDSTKSVSVSKPVCILFPHSK